MSSSLNDIQPALSVTVYNENTALVSEKRTLQLVEGIQKYTYDDVASEIIPTSVLLESETIQVLEQDYEFDLISSTALLKRYVGKVINILLKNDSGNIAGRLINSGFTVKGNMYSEDSVYEALIIEEEDGHIRMLKPDAISGIEFPELPQGLATKPALHWILKSSSNGLIDARLSYMTNGLSWKASYIAVVSENDDAVTLEGWAQILNHSGKSYEDTKLKLMAGDVQIKSNASHDHMRYHKGFMDEAKNSKNAFEEHSFFEYHLYTLPHLVTLKNKQKKQLSLFKSVSTSAQKTYSYSFAQNTISVAMEFVNAEANGLGIPLPAGNIRVMKRDIDGQFEFIGEDNIEHTARDEKIIVNTGKAFEIVAARKITSERRNKDLLEFEVTVEFRNHKDTAVEITTKDKFYTNWRIDKESISGINKPTDDSEWLIEIPANGLTTIRYNATSRVTL